MKEGTEEKGDYQRALRGILRFENLRPTSMSSQKGLRESISKCRTKIKHKVMGIELVFILEIGEGEMPGKNEVSTHFSLRNS